MLTLYTTRQSSTVSLLFIISLFFNGLLFAQDQNESQLATLNAEDFFNLKTVGSPVYSPEGEWIAYTVRSTSLEENASETRIWMVSTDGSQTLAMTGPGTSASDPSWSPDGRYLSFLAARNDGETQVWAMNRAGGEAEALTDIEQGVNSYYWSPDSSKLLLIIKDPEVSEEEESTDANDEPKPWVIDRLQFKRDYAGYLDRRRNHLYVFDVNTNDKTVARQVTFGDYDDSAPVWSPNGEQIAFVSNRTIEPDANDNTDIWTISAVDENPELIRVTSNPGGDYSPSWSADGNWITYASVTEPELIWYATSHLAVVPAAGGEERVLTNRIDRNISAPRFKENSSEDIVFMIEDSGERHLATIDRTGENFSRLIDGNISIRGFSLGPRNELAALLGNQFHPPEVFHSVDNSLTQLTFTNNEFLNTKELAEVENIQFDSADGTEVEGFIFKPPGFQEGVRYPTLLRIHGGPVSQYDFNFNFEAQLFAANGYVVVLTNPRGSSGYGQEFSHALWANWGEKDTEDVLAGVDHAIALGYSDPDKLGVGGWSYGGILTNYVITKSTRFKGAISGASEVLYRSNYGHDHYQRHWEAELGLPWEEAENWERISPFNDVANVVTPTLIMGGEKDWNVPIINSEQLYQALKRLGIETQLVVYPGEHHGIRLPNFQLDRFNRNLAWYEQYVK